jgi:cytochrome c-type biogenesis protein CcmH
MGLFHAVAGVLALLIALFLVRPLIAGRAGALARGARDAQLYRDQLNEIARDLERGSIGAAEAEGARAEVSRRLLGASLRAETDAPLRPAPRRTSALVAGIALIGAPALALALYVAHGAPDLRDLPFVTRAVAPPATFAQRPTQAEAEAVSPPASPPPLAAEERDYAELIAQLEAIVAQRPDDIEGRRLLANGYMRLGRHAEAWRVYDTLIGLLGNAAEPELYAAQVDAMAMATGGYISPEAEQVLAEAIAGDPSMPVTRYYSGLLLAQQGRLDEAVAVWEKLRAEVPAGAPWAEFLDMMLVEARAVQPSAPGPDAAEVEAAAAMSPDERQAMIEGMVGRLEQRLTAEGGAVEEWLRLIKAYVQLGKPEEARRIYALGVAAFGNSSEAGFLREQALVLGVIAE